MIVSVILSAYNGGLYLAAQLDSLVNQTRLPDEIIVINDCSNDNGETIAIIDRFSSRYTYIRKVENRTNLGWKKSFMLGVKLAKGDVILFCDQDDIWMNSKIEDSLKALKDSGAAGVVCACKNFFLDEIPAVYSLEAGELNLGKIKFDKRFHYTKQVGAALALKKDFALRFLSHWNKELAYDCFFEALLLLFDNLVYFDKLLILHRLHGNNATGRRSYNLAERIKDSKSKIDFFSSILESENVQMLESGKIITLKNCLRFQVERNAALSKRSIIRWSSLISDISYYPTWKTWFGDLICILRG